MIQTVAISSRVQAQGSLIERLPDVTHDQEEAMELADLVVVMSMGRIEQVGKPEDIRARPKTAFVKEFISA